MQGGYFLFLQIIDKSALKKSGISVIIKVLSYKKMIKTVRGVGYRSKAE